MSEYTPDKWVIIKVTGKNHPPIHRVFACWYGGWAGSDSWKINSGITKVTENTDYFFFDGYSGSTYACRKGSYGLNMYGNSILMNLREQLKAVDGTIDILDENTNWLEINYE
jgi:hypothetical protein